LLISRLQAVLGAAVLIVATAAISIIVVSKWNLFPPTDYEDCAARAAKEAKSKDGLSVLLSICESEFAGRRKPGGGYTYYESCPGRTFDFGRTFDINGPNPTLEEQKHMRQQCLAKLEAERQAGVKEAQAEREVQQAAREASAEKNKILQARQWAATTAVDVTLVGFKCSYLEAPSCDHVDLKARANNRSKESLSGLTIGLASVPTKNDPCPVSFEFQRKTRVFLSPGETDLFEIMHLDSEFSKHPVYIESARCSNFR
jgi:hypothetical protein